jgi:hypothetical protein
MSHVPRTTGPYFVHPRTLETHRPAERSTDEMAPKAPSSRDTVSVAAEAAQALATRAASVPASPPGHVFENPRVLAHAEAVRRGLNLPTPSSASSAEPAKATSNVTLAAPQPPQR